MGLELVTGFWEMEHVTAEQDADLNAGIIGSQATVLPVGEKMRAEAVTSNKIRIFDGIFMAYGRQCMLDSGEFEDVTIENGSAGLLRNDMIVIKYKKDEVKGYEKAEFAVLKGQTGAAAVDPVPNNQNIRDGAFESEVPMYRVCLNGLAIEKIEPLFEVTMTNKDLADKYRELNSALNNFIPVKIKSTQYIEKVTGGYIKIGKIVVFSISFTPKTDIQNGAAEVMTGFPEGLCNGKFSDTTNVYYDGVDSRYIHIANGEISIKGPHSAGTEYHASGCYIAKDF